MDVALVKVGGAELAEGPVLDRLVAALVPMARERSLVIVHGGGPDIATLQKRLGLVPRFLDGLRITDEDSLWAAEMVLSGSVNKRLVARLVMQGVLALGISGVDAGLLHAERLTHPSGDLGRVGRITRVDAACLTTLLAMGFTPVVSPISLGEDGRPYNVNADHAAFALAAALSVAELIMLTDVPGVLEGGQVLKVLPAHRASALIEQGLISGGMIPKVRSALEAVAHGIASARITDLAGLASGTGTRVTS